MGLNAFPAALVFAALTLGVAWMPGPTRANFGEVQGASGMGGITCASCHQPPHPTEDDAVAHLEGLPSGWVPGQTYELHISVTGGPDALPAPAPQGGFELAASAGTLAPDPANPQLFHSSSPHELGYTPAGALRRGWTVLWTAPGLESAPGQALFWLAVLAANGNHVVALGASDGGETLDATATLQASVPPAPETVAAWHALPLLAPTATAQPTPEGWRIDGAHTDGNATSLLFQADEGAWQTRPTGRQWRLLLPSGPHALHFRSEGSGRTSALQTLLVGDAGPASDNADNAQPGADSRAAPAPLLPILALAALAASTRRTSA